MRVQIPSPAPSAQADTSSWRYKRRRTVTNFPVAGALRKGMAVKGPYHAGIAQRQSSWCIQGRAMARDAGAMHADRRGPDTRSRLQCA